MIWNKLIGVLMGDSAGSGEVISSAPLGSQRSSPGPGTGRELPARQVLTDSSQAPGMSGGGWGGMEGEGRERLRLIKRKLPAKRSPLRLGQGVCTAKLCNHFSGGSSYTEEQSHI